MPLKIIRTLSTHTSSFKFTQNMSSSTQHQSSIVSHPTHHVEYWSSSSTYNTLVVVPSLSFDCDLLRAIKAVSHYEERLLYNLILLKNPNCRIIYLSSLPVDEDIVNYYWDLIQTELHEKIAFDEVRPRLTMLNCSDARPDIPLIKKILDRPKLVNRIKGMLTDAEHSCLSVYVATEKEEQLAKLLRIDFLAGNVKSHHYYGTKHGSKELFSQCAIPTPPYTPLVFSEERLIEEICKLMRSHKEAKKLVIKMNEGFSGEGNALLCLDPLREHIQDLEQIIGPCLENMHFIGNGMTWAEYRRKIQTLGVIAELFVENNGSNPSCQALIDSNGDVVIMSTHDQVMDDQIYLGCCFPADVSYRTKLIEYTKRIGEGLAKEGVQSHFGVDFLVGEPQADSNEVNIQAMEINLRQCGTTHTFVTMKLLTNAVCDPKTGDCVSIDDGHQKCYIASDNLCFDAFEGLLPQDVRDYEHFPETLHFSRSTKTGVVFHLLGAASQFGKIGIVAIANSENEARELYDKAIPHFLEYATLEKRQSTQNSENLCAQGKNDLSEV
mmetsp:Transcript_4908/g.18456  ORF Transcript_4908/g.18456 Transcript_4908/m.18456 type:complete len:551 (+) Transcript_4908:123-1775(+)